MSENETETIQATKPSVPWGAVTVILAGLLIVGWLITRTTTRPLKPLRLTVTPSALEHSGQPVIVTFDELNADPNAFRNQNIRITGAYTPQEKPDCFNYSGPVILWALISSDLQLNAQGFESILALVPDGTTLTVEGVWQLFEGPVGCGKGPAPAQVWYLQVERIVQPNPLPNFGDAPPKNTPDPEATAVPEPDELTPTPEPGATAVALPSPTPLEEDVTPTPTLPASATIPAFATATPTATPIDEDGRFTATPTQNARATAAATPTIDLSATATPTPDGAPTNTPIATPLPLVTATPGPSPTPGEDGYPGPASPTPSSGDPTETPDPYPPS